MHNSVDLDGIHLRQHAEKHQVATVSRHSEPRPQVVSVPVYQRLFGHELASGSQLPNEGTGPLAGILRDIVTDFLKVFFGEARYQQAARDCQPPGGSA